MRYVMLVGEGGAKDSTSAAATESKLLGMGLQPHCSSASVRLFATKSTPILSLPRVGTIIGNMFFQDGSPVLGSDRFPNFAGHAQARKYILEQCWGPYLLLQAEVEGGGVTVLRNPSASGDAPCFYSIRSGDGFITSDISIPEELGLFRRSVNWSAISHRLLYPQLKSARTALTDIQELLPGCALKPEGFKAVAQAAWSPWTFVAADSRHSDFQEAATDVRDAVALAVRTLANLNRSVLLERPGLIDHRRVSG